ncbi:MAG TPA: FAD-dependent oxidoreductase, partial [Pyrinomonadaceae bacterium]|nr:FAD-dependent oxidoreductase [Pyrinomonadaceae bacterium]
MHDVIIIGAGPAGLSTAFWCDEVGLDTLVLERAEQIGGQLHRVYNPIENYLGVKTRNGEEFLALFAKDVESAEFDLWTQAIITSVDLKAKRITLASGETLQSIAIVIASGVSPRELGVPGEKEFVGKGIIQSGTRDRQIFAG